MDTNIANARTRKLYQALGYEESDIASLDVHSHCFHYMQKRGFSDEEPSRFSEAL